MRWHLPIRLGYGAALAALLWVTPSHAMARAPQPAAQPGAMKPTRPQARQIKPVQKEEHLQKWMDRHSNLSLSQQLNALENEPGFRESPAQTQQRMRDELVRLNSMTPQQRSRITEGAEALERMSPQQRQQFNSSVQQYRSLPADRKRLVTKAFRDLREMPQAQRQGIINSEQFRSQFSDTERATLSNLLVWEPYFSNRGLTDNP